MKHRKILIMSNVAIIAYYAAFLLWAELSQPGEGETVVMHAYSGFSGHGNDTLVGVAYVCTASYHIGFGHDPCQS